MYEAHFNLRRRPFPTTPDNEFYYPASVHEQALAQLTQALQDGEGYLLLLSPPGLGKTLLGQRLLDQAVPEACSVFLTHSQASNLAGFLQSLLFDLGLPYEGKSEQELRLALTDHLLKNYQSDRPTLFLLDEAHHLPPAMLEELRLLGNLEGSKGKALQVVLLAQPSLEETLRRPELAALRQRVACHARLAPLNVHEAADYLVHHLRLAGGHPETFMTDEALELLACGSGGIPRLLNRVGHTALRLAWQASAEAVDAEVALESLGLHGLAAAEVTAAAPGLADLGTPTLEVLGDGVTEEAGTAAAVLHLEPQTVKPHERLEAARGRRLFAAPKQPA